MFMTAEVTGSWYFWMILGAGVAFATTAAPQDDPQLGTHRPAASTV
jgi:hypothetical protein